MFKSKSVSGQISDSIDDGVRPLSKPLTTLISTNLLTSFLDDAITNDIDLIVSSVRKGSWIIEDYLRRSGKNILHLTTREYNPGLHKQHKILIFDDSVHTGKTVLSVVDKTRNAYNTTICCILINSKAITEFEKRGLRNIIYYRKFDEYTRYKKKNGVDQELLSDCQSYCYSHFLIPYISGLTYNYSPDYTSFSILLENHSSSLMGEISDAVFKSLGTLIGDSDLIYADHRVRRLSAPLADSVVRECVDNLLGGNYELDQSKLRVSVVIWDGYAEVVLTPIVSYITDQDRDHQKLLIDISRCILDSISDKILQFLKDSGYLITTTRYFGAAHREGDDE